MGVVGFVSWCRVGTYAGSMPWHEYVPTTCDVNGFATSADSPISAARKKTFAARSSGSSIDLRDGAFT